MSTGSMNPSPMTTAERELQERQEFDAAHKRIFGYHPHDGYPEVRLRWKLWQARAGYAAPPREPVAWRYRLTELPDDEPVRWYLSHAQPHPAARHFIAEALYAAPVDREGGNSEREIRAAIPASQTGQPASAQEMLTRRGILHAADALRGLLKRCSCEDRACKQLAAAIDAYDAVRAND